MALSGALSDFGRRSLSALSAGAASGLSGNRMLAVLAEQGLGYRRQDFLRDYALVRGTAQQAERVRFVRRDYLPSPDLLPPALTRTLREYSFTVRITGYDPDLGGSVEEWVNVASDRLMTPAEIEAEAEQYLTDRERYAALETQEVQVVSGVRSGRLGSLL